MRLKVSPTEALRSIDQLLQDGHRQYLAISTEIETYNRGRKVPPSPEIDLEDPAGICLAKPGLTTVPGEKVKEFNTAFYEWYSLALKKCEALFLDYAPRFALRAKIPGEPILGGWENTCFRCWRMLEVWGEKLNVLFGFYRELEKQAWVPLIYLKEKAEIWFSGICCPLQQKSKEALLCEYMITQDFGKPIAFADVLILIEGYNTEGWSSHVVQNAADGVNKKTRKQFGFSIFGVSKRAQTIKFQVPSSLLSAIVQSPPVLGYGK